MKPHFKTSWVRKQNSWWSDFISLWYPNACAVCKRNLVSGELTICTICKINLPRTGFHLSPGNPVEKQFWGKINFERATAFLFFHKQGATQHIIHLLKYKGRTDIGEWLGREIGKELNDSFPFNKADVIIPVPLHPDKQCLRGYNQSECLATGLSTMLKVPTDNTALARVRMNETQTHKSRIERWTNVSELFECVKPHVLSGKRILLIDDVLTTGSTMEACAQAIYKHSQNVKINFIAAAMAHH